MHACDLYDTDFGERNFAQEWPIWAGFAGCVPEDTFRVESAFKGMLGAGNATYEVIAIQEGKNRIPFGMHVKDKMKTVPGKRAFRSFGSVKNPIRANGETTLAANFAFQPAISSASELPESESPWKLPETGRSCHPE